MATAPVLSKTPSLPPAPIAPGSRMLTAAEFHRLADVPLQRSSGSPIISNPSTRRAYENAIRVTSLAFQLALTRPDEFRTVTRAHIIAWCDRSPCERGLGGSHHPAPPGFARLTVGVPVREATLSPTTRSRASSGPRSESSRRQDAGNRRPPGPRELLAAPERRHRQKQARPRHPVHTPVSCAAARGVVQAQGPRRPATPAKACRTCEVSGKGGKTRYVPLHPGHPRAGP